MRCCARGEAGWSAPFWMERVSCRSVWRNMWCGVEGLVWESSSFSGFDQDRSGSLIHAKRRTFASCGFDQE